MSYPASASILSLFSPFPTAPLRGLRSLPGLPGLAGRAELPRKLDLVQDGSRILIGSIAAPYLTENPEEGRRDLVLLREMLRARREGERQDEAAGLTIAITTRSPLLLHDLDLLVELDREHAVSVDVLLPDLDPDVVRRLEPHLAAPPAPEARLELVRRLAAEGIATRVLCVPLPAGVAAAESRLAALFDAAHEAGAWDLALQAPQTPQTPETTELAQPDGASGRSGRRSRFRAWKRWSSSAWPLPSPRLHTRGQRHPQPAEQAPGAKIADRADSLEALLSTFYRLRLEHGFPRATPGRG